MNNELPTTNLFALISQFCHSRGGGNPVFSLLTPEYFLNTSSLTQIIQFWIPAFAGKSFGLPNLDLKESCGERWILYPFFGSHRYNLQTLPVFETAGGKFDSYYQGKCNLYLEKEWRLTVTIL
jgi:hypothetical protein